MMRYLWMAVVLMLACGVVAGQTQKGTHYIKEDATIDGQSHRIDLIEISDQGTDENNLILRYLYATKKTSSGQLFFAVLANDKSKTENVCAYFPAEDQYSNVNSIEKEIQTINKKNGGELFIDSITEIESEAWSGDKAAWDKTHNFKNREVVMKSLWNQCNYISWEKMVEILSGEKANPGGDGSEKSVTPADGSGATPAPSETDTAEPEEILISNTHDNQSKPSEDGLTKLTSELNKMQNKIISLEVLKDDLEVEVLNKVTEIEKFKETVDDLEKQKKVHAGELISALSDSLKWKLWVVVALVFFFIAAYLFFMWVIAQAAKRIESGTKEILYRFGITDSTLDKIKTQMPIRGASTDDLSNQLKEIHELIAEKASKICDLNARFQVLFAQLQKSEKTARELNVDTAVVSLYDEQLPNSFQIQSIDQPTQMEKDALQIRRLLDEIKELHPKNTMFSYSRTERIDALKSYSDLALSRIPILLNIMLKYSEHIASLFHSTLMELSKICDENHQLKKQLDEKSVKIEDITRVATHYSSLLAGELKKIGYLDRKAGIDREEFNNALTEFTKDNENRPEFLEYGRSLSSLRRYLSNERLQELPYFDAVGLRQLSNTLDDKKSLIKLFEDKDPARPLKGQWKEFLQSIYRAILLLDTYWPNADKELRAKLEQTRSTTDLLLRSQGIAPHTLSLLEEAKVDNTTIQETSNATIPRELESNEIFRDRVKPLSDIGVTYCDVAFWGYDIIRDDQVTLGKSTLLVTKEPGSRWE